MTEGASSDPFIAPEVLRLNGLLEAGKLTVVERGKPWPAMLSVVPETLLPFVEAPTVNKLADLLREHPALYWHPLVYRQIVHLKRLTWDEERVGVAQEQLMKLVEAHVSRLHLGKEIGWKGLPRKRGPKDGIENPYPAMPGDERIDPGTLARDFVALRDLFHAKLEAELGKKKALKYSGTKGEVNKRYRDLALKMLKGSDIDWSGLKSQAATELAAPTKGGADSTESVTDYFTAEDLTDPEPWKAAEESLGDAILKRLTPGVGHLRKEGEPAHLAYVTLGALLDVQPTKVRDSIENYRRKKKARKPMQTSS